MNQANIPDAMVKEFSEAVSRHLAKWNAMTPPERLEHYETQILETKTRIAELEAKPVEPYRELHRQVALEMMNHDLVSYQDAADYYRAGGKTLKELSEEA